MGFTNSIAIKKAITTVVLLVSYIGNVSAVDSPNNTEHSVIHIEQETGYGTFQRGQAAKEVILVIDNPTHNTYFEMALFFFRISSVLSFWELYVKALKANRLVHPDADVAFLSRWQRNTSLFSGHQQELDKLTVIVHAPYTAQIDGQIHCGATDIDAIDNISPFYSPETLAEMLKRCGLQKVNELTLVGPGIGNCSKDHMGEGFDEQHNEFIKRFYRAMFCHFNHSRLNKMKVRAISVNINMGILYFLGSSTPPFLFDEPIQYGMHEWKNSGWFNPLKRKRGT